ncbi:MAG: AMP-binding protein [Acidimicrobiia bacterium]
MIDAVGTRSIVDLLDDRVAAAPQQIGLVAESAGGVVIPLTYAQIDDLSRKAATGLLGIGVGPGDRVLVHLSNCSEMLVIWFALARIGAILVPSNTANTAREIGHIARTADVRLGVCRPDGVELLEAADADRLARDRLVSVAGAVPGCVEFAALVTEPRLEGASAASAGDIAELVFTSGTTSAPKAAMITHANCLHSGLQKAAAMGITDRDRLLSALPLFHVNAQSAFFAALVAGATFVTVETYSAARYCTQLVDHGATVTSFVSTQVRTLLRQPPDESHRAHRVDRAWFALDISEAECDEFEQRFGIRLLNGYGLTEAFTSVCQTPLHSARRWPTVGLPLLGRQLRVIAPDGSEAPNGTPGEIVVGGVQGRTLMAGYWNDPEATARAVRDGWLYTGDVGAIDEAGYLQFVGRKADMIKRAGENIAAAEVEGVLLAHPEVTEAAVVGVPDPIRDEEVVAFVSIRSGSTLAISELEQYARQHLAAFKVPTRWSLRGELPKTSIGKTNKRVLRAEASDDDGLLTADEHRRVTS